MSIPRLPYWNEACLIPRLSVLAGLVPAGRESLGTRPAVWLADICIISHALNTLLSLYCYNKLFTPTVSTSGGGQTPDYIHTAENHCCCEGYQTGRRWYVVYSLQHAFVDHLNDIDNFKNETAICDIFMLHLWEP